MVGIVILNYNTWDYTTECIESILGQEMGVPYSIYLVDNASQKKMPRACRKFIDKEYITFIQAKENRGYAAGNNLGIREAISQGCDMILISNNDVVFQAGTIKVLYTYLLEHPNVGIVGPKVLKQNGKMQETNLGCKMTLKGKYLYILRKTPFRRMAKDFVNQFRIKEETLKENRKVFMVSGCCFMMRKEVIEKIDFLDEDTFLYEEENILGCQMEQIGYDVYLLPKAEVFHKHGQTTKGCKAFSFTCMVESEIYYCRTYLEESLLKIWPLYMIRTIEYFQMSLKNIDYRKNINDFFYRTMKKMWRR